LPAPRLKLPTGRCSGNLRGNQELQNENASKKKRVLSGMRPTGRLHIGNYFGALANWVKLQEDPSNECYFFIADWHSLTSDYADTSQIAQNSIEIVTDFLAAGLDPKKVTIFQQSQVPEHAELHLLLSMITPLGWLERVPTYKEALESFKGTAKDLNTFGFLGYPVLQTADIVIYGEEAVPLFVPVGEDQVPHIELSREIVQAFNFHFGFEIDKRLYACENYEMRKSIWNEFEDPPYEAVGEKGPNDKAFFEYGGTDFFSHALRQTAREVGLENFRTRAGEAAEFFQVREVLSRPAVILTQTPRIPGTDGRKMSKSYGNAITLSESDEDIRTKTRAMITDPARKRRTDPGNPDVCPVYDWHKLFSPSKTLEWAAEGCCTAGIGCIECKSAMADNLIKWIAPIRARREEYAAHPARVLEIIDAGSKVARKTAQGTMERVREAIFGWNAKRASISGAAQPEGTKQKGAGD
jgi:tryptophanyl-tRNA synthetase